MQSPRQREQPVADLWPGSEQPGVDRAEVPGEDGCELPRRLALAERGERRVALRRGQDPARREADELADVHLRRVARDVPGVGLPQQIARERLVRDRREGAQVLEEAGGQ